jgi:hypothetical protein
MRCFFQGRDETDAVSLNQAGVALGARGGRLCVSDLSLRERDETRGRLGPTDVEPDIQRAPRAIHSDGGK